MPQLANLVLTDRASTPVNHTFTPKDIVSGVATVEESTGVPIGNNKVTLSLSRNGSGRFKATIKGTFPIVQTQTINGVSSPVVVRTATAELNFYFAETSTEQERKDVVGMMYSALDPSKTLVNDVVTKLQNVY
nr:MAG: coat protein [Sanya fiers-like virus 27]